MLFSWGWTGFGQTGTGHPGSGIEQGVESPTRVAFPPKKRTYLGDDDDKPTPLVSLAAGNFHSAAVDADGNLFTWGNAR